MDRGIPGKVITEQGAAHSNQIAPYRFSTNDSWRFLKPSGPASRTLERWTSNAM